MLIHFLLVQRYKHIVIFHNVLKKKICHIKKKNNLLGKISY